MSEHVEHVTVEAWSADCIEGECDHIDEDGMPDDLSTCPGFPMEVCVECQVERGLTNDPAWWEGAFSPWPCEFVPEPAVPLFEHGPAPEPPKFKPSLTSAVPSPCVGCGGDGVEIDDDPESTRVVVTTCRVCGGTGSGGS